MKKYKCVDCFKLLELHETWFGNDGPLCCTCKSIRQIKELGIIDKKYYEENIFNHELERD